MTGRTKKKVLIVDDEQDVALYLTEVLEDHGYEALSTSDSLEAFDLIMKERPDLILMDIVMPRESGVSLFKKIRGAEEIRDTPIVIITGLSQEQSREIRRLALNGGASLPEAQLEKPIERERFLKTVAGLIG